MPTETGLTDRVLTGTRQSGLSREAIHGKVQSMDYETEHHIGAIIFLAVLAVIGVGLYLWSGM